MAPEHVVGYKKLLPENQNLFARFFNNYISKWEDPEDHMPVKVSFKKDSANGAYLRVDLKNSSWLHVKSASCWY